MQYYFRDQDKVYGPYTAKQVQRMRANGLLNNLTPFTVERPQSQRIGATVALVALFAIIVLCVALLLQKPLPTQATSTTPNSNAVADGSTENSPAPAASSVSPENNGAGETPIESTDSGIGETHGDVETPIESTNDDVGETYYKLDDGSGGGSATASVFGASGTGRYFVFVLDRSGSMRTSGMMSGVMVTGRIVGSPNGTVVVRSNSPVGAGDVINSGTSPFRAACNELLRAISELNENHQINIIAYDDQIDILFPQLTPASDANKDAVRKFLDSLAPRGGTQHALPLGTAVGMAPDVVFLITDANSSDDLDEEAYQRILQLRRASQINVIQFGNHNSPRLKQLTSETGGSFVQHATF